MSELLMSIKEKFDKEILLLQNDIAYEPDFGNLILSHFAIKEIDTKNDLKQEILKSFEHITELYYYNNVQRRQIEAIHMPYLYTISY